MIKRPFWIERIEVAWKEAPIAWLSGVRRSGKTTLVHDFDADRVEFLNCDLPSVGERVGDPERFYRDCRKPVIVFDEIHQLKDPSRLLKIGADEFPQFRILATGSSTLAASKKFSDTLTGRKRSIHLTPVTWSELPLFNNAPLHKRLFHGGLPPALLADTKPDGFYREWLDSFFARDIQKLFGFRDAEKFNTVFECLMKQNAGLLDVTSMASDVGISRQTVENHVRALEIAHGLTVVRPFHGGGKKELIKMPKVYGFDTGFVSFCKGWDSLRPADLGALWENLVLEFLQAQLPSGSVRYWRDTAGREVDFVIPHGRDNVDAIECKWQSGKFDPAALIHFRSFYPKGKNYLISPIHYNGHHQSIKGLDLHVCNPDGWLARNSS